MAASTWIMNGPLKALPHVSFLYALLLHGAILVQSREAASPPDLEPPINAAPTAPLNRAAARGDWDEPQPTPAYEETETSKIFYPSVPELDDFYMFTWRTVISGKPGVVDTSFKYPTSAPPRVSGPRVPQKSPAARPAEPQADVQCVDKEAIQHKDVVSLKLKTTSTCEESRVKIESILEHLCGDDCKLEVFQEDNSDQLLISGQYIEADAKGMAEKFNNDNIKDKIDVEEAVPHWGKHSQNVLVALLLAGLLLAALLIAGYYLKTHRGQHAKGVRLAEESFQVDEENQGNTLVSVAPLHPQEPQDKPNVNGESQPPPTNGHSATQCPVADTEM